MNSGQDNWLEDPQEGERVFVRHSPYSSSTYYIGHITRRTPKRVHVALDGRHFLSREIVFRIPDGSVVGGGGFNLVPPTDDVIKCILVARLREAAKSLDSQPLETLEKVAELLGVGLEAQS